MAVYHSESLISLYDVLAFLRNRRDPVLRGVDVPETSVEGILNSSGSGDSEYRFCGVTDCGVTEPDVVVARDKCLFSRKCLRL